MNTRRLLVACLAAIAALLGAADRAAASLGQFGLNSFVISPPSGTATWHDVLTIQMSGVAGTTLIPTGVSVSAPTPDARLIALTTPNSLGLTIPTPWSLQVVLSPMAIGSHDFSVSGIIAFGTPSETVIGTELAFDNFVVVPEPTGAVVACTATVLGVARRRGGVRRPSQIER